MLACQHRWLPAISIQMQAKYHSERQVVSRKEYFLKVKQVYLFWGQRCPAPYNIVLEKIMNYILKKMPYMENEPVDVFKVVNGMVGSR